MLDFRIIILFSATLIILWLAMIMYRRSRELLVFSLFIFSVFFWSLSLGIFYVSQTERIVDIWGRLVYVFGSLVPVVFFEFSLLYTKKKIRPLLHLFIFLPNIILAYCYLFTTLFIQQTLTENMMRGYVYGDLKSIFDLHLMLTFGASFLTLYLTFRNVKDINQRLQFLYIMIGTLAGLTITLTTNVVFPWYENFNFLWAGPIGAGIWAGILTYGISRHHLLSTKLIATETFVGSIWFILFLNITIFNSLTELIFNIFIFIISLFFGYLLVRSVRKEVEQREELERLSKELSSANEKLQALDKAKSEFISIASHQLRAPLTIIRGYISLMLEGTLGTIEEKGKDALHKVEYSANQLIKLVSDLLNLSRIESGKIKYELAKADFVAVMRKIFEEFGQSAQKKNIAFTFKNEAPDLPRFIFDESKIREVGINLIDNAIKYSTPGGVVQISIQYNSTKSLVRTEIQDSGMGIKKGDLGKLFTKFARTEEATKLDPNGMGIGLYFVKRVIEDHKGKVWVESEGQGKGSTFFVELPLDMELKT